MSAIDPALISGTDLDSETAAARAAGGPRVSRGARLGHERADVPVADHCVLPAVAEAGQLFAGFFRSQV